MRIKRKLPVPKCIKLFLTAPFFLLYGFLLSGLFIVAICFTLGFCVEDFLKWDHFRHYMFDFWSYFLFAAIYMIKKFYLILAILIVGAGLAQIIPSFDSFTTVIFELPFAAEIIIISFFSIGYWFFSCFEIDDEA